MTISIRQDDPQAPHVAQLLAYHLAQVRAVMEEYAFALDASELSDPDITFWSAWIEGELAGICALKMLDPTHAEVKSMRAAPSATGKGVGRAMMDHLIAEARRRGAARLSLETGVAPMHMPAVGLYRSAGFVSCGPFADYEESAHNQFFTMDLSALQTV
ncbi:GNAT family N-acetyltransferase [Novosphingobium sp. 9]|uniref:GNAT family N-acetyltransferase n=1 Tax=Novosphingobium sp. 9 TaxID=2025349 RepID=UPI0021B67018|nr:GNAT family N-acetyltransferase [Novosphingobium sp. 9]